MALAKGRDTYVGFDSTWTDNAKAPGAVYESPAPAGRSISGLSRSSPCLSAPARRTAPGMLVDQKTPRLIADHYPPQIVRMTVLER